ncbi:MAG TPA: hypothetical protein PLZ77_00620 [Lachnospiraceae bacterium]|nr:hypothetical protein [Lachnospiraceae bacterium]HPF28587.1 hypothetical protein [Lachnospiraceae bacterium]
MKKISMVEYQGRCDIQGRAVGHAPKVLEEYYNFIKDDYNVRIFAPEVISKQLPVSLQKDTCELPYRIIMKGKKSFLAKITDKMHMFGNIKKAIYSADAEVLWFFNVEYYLMLYLFLHRKPKQKIVCTMFLDGYHGNVTAKVKQWVFEKAQKKIDIILSSGRKFLFANTMSEFIPDYYYRPEIYQQYQQKSKEPYAVCLGTMGKGKELEEMVQAFNRIGYSLQIAGRFYDHERLVELKRNAGENITIEDSYLSQEEYLTKLSKAAYVVLPYSPGQYATQTSGVMQEALFVNTIVISYQDVLDGAGMSGIGFHRWDDLTKELLQTDHQELLCGYQELRETVYAREQIRADYRKVFEGVINERS